MAYKIAIASGKGGTGKTTIAVNLSNTVAQLISSNVLLVDCDVEEPNDLIFFNKAKLIHSQNVTQLVPSINTDKCTYCKRCSEYCEFNAIAIIPNMKIASIDGDLCHSCGACLVACNDNAISESPIKIGVINHYDNGIGNGLIEGRLAVGSSMQTMVIKALKRDAGDKNAVVIYDAPPGTSCPVVETVSDVDYVILVTEPTPFGLYDLQLTIQLLNDLNKDFGVIINKAGLGNEATHNYLHYKGIDILGEIPFSRNYAAKYASGDLLDNIPAEIALSYEEIALKLKPRLCVRTS